MDSAEALKMYGEHFGQKQQDTLFSYNVSSLDAFTSDKRGMVEQNTEIYQVHTDLVRDLSQSQEEDKCKVCEKLCHHCGLPLGHNFYECEDKKGIHGECLAQVMVQEMRKEDDARLQAQREQKRTRHEEYGIGWDVECIPRNDASAKQLVLQDVPQGMVCIVLDEETKTIGVASTLEPAAALNLEYLSTALAVRREEGHELFFSLDPVSNDSNAMQEKKFVPDWLAGTRAGDVLFQADYHLKELSMGEYDQPVVGMRSCFDYSEMENMEAEWRAREWFMVRKAEVHISGNSVLRPYVKMGVEAREQTMTGNSMEDKQITRANHPMVMYAEQFTKNFDLIAERKSVVYHLRELAKASVLAKYLLESGVQLEEPWFHLASQAEVACSLEVPQLWNERVSAKVDVEGGIVNNQHKSRMHGVYGGVQFGLDKFNLSTSVSRAPGASLSAGMPKHRLAYGLSRRAGLAPVSNIMSMASGAQFAPPSAALSTSLTGAPRLAASIGVSPLRAGMALPSAALSATIAPRLATSISVSVSASMAAAPRLATTLGASIGTAPRLASTLSASIGAPPRLATTLGASIGAAPRLATSIGASIGAAPRLAASMSATVGATPRLATSLGASIGAAPRLAASVMPPHRLAAQISAASKPSLAASIGGIAPARLQGVDLRLDNFDLSEAKNISSETLEWCGELQPLEAGVSVGKIFWSGLEDAKIFKDEDRALLRKVFDRKLSDRRAEGDLFVPPDASHSYVSKLRALVKEEDSMRKRRTANFSSKSFSMEEPGVLFPFTWKPSFESSSCTMQRPHGSLESRPDYMDQAEELLQDALRESSPIFDKSTEDGLRFRIYILGSLEVRTVQGEDGKEEVVAVFAICNRAAAIDQDCNKVQDNERVAKATQYVERSFGKHYRYYVVLETEHGQHIRMESLAEGEVAWEPEPADLEDRNSLAKVIQTASSKPGVLLGDVKAYQNSLVDTTSKFYAQSVFVYATDGTKPTSLKASLFRPPMLMASFCNTAKRIPFKKSA
jgi:hypothetical protein